MINSHHSSNYLEKTILSLYTKPADFSYWNVQSSNGLSPVLMNDIFKLRGEQT